ncbi:MAG: hypothetical protein Q7R90_03795 [bacterium]|nr:hypothetical protein [bacterium]
MACYDGAMGVEFSAQARETPLSSGRERLPALALDNTVLEVNPAFNGTLPFDLREGTKGDLALFFGEETGSDKELGVREFHWRSGDLGKIVFRDTEGRKYRDVDLKGCGYLRQTGLGPIHNPQWEQDTASGHYGYLGLLDKDRAQNDSYVSELLTTNGIRTHRSLAIFELKELPVGGRETLKRVPIPELREQGLLDEQYDPVIQMRAFGTKTRLGEPVTAADFDDAISLIRLEGGTSPATRLEYLDWFIETLGKGIGRMHKLGYVHRYLTERNVTLDCRMVDLDAAKRAGDMPEGEWEEARRRDVAHKRHKRGGRGVVAYLAAELGRTFRDDIGYLAIEELYRRFEDVYVKESGFPFPNA